MSIRISAGTIQLIEKLYADKLPIRKIAEIAHVSYLTAYGYTKAIDRGFKSPTDYYNHLAKKRGYGSAPEYREHMIELMELSPNVYEKNLARRRINPDTQAPFASRAEYDAFRAAQRRKMPGNRRISRLIITRLAQIGETQAWLARQTGLSKETISRYVHGENLPDKTNLGKLFRALYVPHEKIMDFAENPDLM